MKRRALGKGLRSLIPEAPPRALGGEPPATEAPDPRHLATERVLELIDIDLIVPNRQQPRRQFDDGALEELASSLKSKGVIQPIVVRPIEDGHYELVVGERRWRAAQRAGLLRVPAIVREIPDDRMLEVALIENIQRENLNPIDEAMAYRSLIQDLRLTQQEVAERVGKQRATIANLIRILSLPDGIQEMVRAGELTAGHAKAIASVDGIEHQEELARKILQDRLSVRAAERLVEWMARQGAVPKERTTARRDPNVVSAEETLQTALGTKVRIFQGRKGAGRIELHFYSNEEMTRVYDLVLDAVKHPSH